ncbi:MAG: chorismate synthase [Clostridia bacterium]|nr:chorismate synthase [Clostridia bacterium]
MSSNFGDKLKISIFGQSHSQAIGVVIDGLPAGVQIDMDKIFRFMARRAPGGQYSTARKEKDTPQILSGIFEDKTCGAPLCAMIENTDTRSQDYKNIKDVPRPSHADFTAFVKHGGANDFRGGGHFSGRLTAPLCFAGAVCKQVLELSGITIGAHICSIADEVDKSFDPVFVTASQLEDLIQKDFAVIDDNKGNAMKDKIAKAKAQGDSVGGTIECCTVGLPVGIGEPIFDGIENKISSAIFGIPAVKGIEFGNGFDACSIFGSQNNDEFYLNNEEIKTKTNNSGGVLGGISTGMPLIFKVAIKPTPSISKEQSSVNLDTGEQAELEIKGRHDPCIVPRAVACVEAATAIALLDLMI